MEKRYAYSLLNVKEITETDDAWIISGIASTPAPDRMGDIVEPKGAIYKLPMPLLWQHQSAKPVGLVKFAKPSADGIPYEAELPKVKEAGALKDRIDEAVQSIKYRLVAAVSIGFNVLEDGYEILKGGGIRFTKWEWLELSLVTIPANADATIDSIKALDAKNLFAASGETKESRRAVRLKSSPGASGQSAARDTGKSMKTYAEQIQEWANKRTTTKAALDELMKKSGEAGESLDAEQQSSFDELDRELEAIDGHLARLKKLEDWAKKELSTVSTSNTQLATVASARSSSTILSVRSNTLPGIGFARFAMAMYQAEGDRRKALEIVEGNKGWMDTTPGVAAMLKTAIPAADTTTSGYASELVYAQNLVNEFIEFLRPMTILGRLPDRFRRVPFNIRVGSQTAGGTGYWVGQGAPIPVSKLTTSSMTLGIAKAAGLMAMDEELARSSSPSAELLIRNDLAKTLQQLLDVAAIDPNQGGVANVQPASWTYGVSPVSPTGTNFAALTADLKTLFAPIITANLDVSKFVWIMTPTTALSLSLMQTSLGNPQFPTININGGTFMGLPVVVSNAANIAGSPDYANMMVLVNPEEIFLADDGQATIDVSREASIQMLDNPTNTSTGSTTPTTVVSMFQTASIAIRAIRFINWKLARSQAVQMIRTANYG